MFVCVMRSRYCFRMFGITKVNCFRNIINTLYLFLKLFDYRQTLVNAIRLMRLP